MIIHQLKTIGIDNQAAILIDYVRSGEPSEIDNAVEGLQLATVLFMCLPRATVEALHAQVGILLENSK